MEKETAINLLTKIFNYFNPPSSWNFFRTNPNQVRAEQIYDTVMSTAKVLSVLVNAVQQVKEAYVRSQSDQLIYQRSFTYIPDDQSNRAEVTVKMDGINFNYLETNNARTVDVPSSKSFQPLVLEPAIIDQQPIVKFRAGLKNQAKLMKLLAPQLPKGMMLGQAYDEGDCFFDALAQLINKINSTNHTARFLRRLCHDFYMNDQDSKDLVDKSNTSDHRGLEVKDDYHFVQYTAQECKQCFKGRVPIWGRPNVEGIILCRVLPLEAISVIEILEDPETQQPVLSFHLVDQNQSKNLSKAEADIWLNNPKIPILVIEQKSLHFVPLLPESIDDRESLDQANEYSSAVRPKF